MKGGQRKRVTETRFRAKAHHIDQEKAFERGKNFVLKKFLTISLILQLTLFRRSFLNHDSDGRVEADGGGEGAEDPGNKSYELEGWSDLAKKHQGDVDVKKRRKRTEGVFCCHSL